MFHHDLTHTGNSTAKAPPKTNNTQWSYKTGGSVYSSPAVANGIVYVGSGDNKVYALNATTGKQVWSYTTGGQVSFSSPDVANGVVYIGSLDKSVYALNATTGKQVWSYTTGAAVWSSPAVANGIVYVGSGDNQVYALNATTGKPVWSYTTGGPVESSPAVASGLVFVGSDDGKVYAVNASTGAKVWNYTTGNWVESSPAIANAIVYVGSIDNCTYALNASTGTLVWKYKTGGGVFSSPAVSNGIVYVGSLDNKVYAINATTGKLIWYYTTGDAVYSSPAVADNVVYIGSLNDWIYAFYYLAVHISPTGIIYMDPGQSKLFTSSVSNGTSPYTYQWYLYGNATIQSTNRTFNFTRSSSGTYTVYVNVTDNAGFRAKSNIANPIVNPQLSARFGPLDVTMDVNQSQQFTLKTTGGNQTYSYKSVPNCVPGLTKSTWTFTPNDTGLYHVYVNVTDSLGVKVQSDVATVTVNPPLSVKVSPTTATIDLGKSQLFNSTVSAGTPFTNRTRYPYSYIYKWYLNNTLEATSQSWNYTPTAAGNYILTLSITDAAQATANSKKIPVYVRNAPKVTISPRSAIVEVGQSQLFNATVSGGTPPFTYQWYLDGVACTGATNSTWNFTSTSKGLHTIYVKVTDNDSIQGTSQVAAITSVIQGHDVTITDLTSYHTIQGKGYNDCGNITAANYGSYTETFNITAYATNTTTTTVIATQSVTLTSGNFTTIAFIWNTKGFAYGNYTISASVTLASGEINNWTGPFTYGSVKVTIPGDVDGNGVVNIFDVIMITSRYGLKQGMPNFNPNCDINQDGIINILDVVICTSHYGQSITDVE
jgi:outer membrane protein assembly factor BamB